MVRYTAVPQGPLPPSLAARGPLPPGAAVRVLYSREVPFERRKKDLFFVDTAAVERG